MASDKSKLIKPEPTDDTVPPPQSLEIGPQLMDLPPWLLGMFEQLGVRDAGKEDLALLMMPIPAFQVGVGNVGGRAAAQIGGATLFDLTLFKGSARALLAPPGQKAAQVVLQDILGAQQLGFVCIVVDGKKVDLEKVRKVNAVGDHRSRADVAGLLGDLVGKLGEDAPEA